MILRRSLVILLPAAVLVLSPVAAGDEPPLTPVGPAVVRGDGRVDPMRSTRMPAAER